jgi:hypothetical protein
VLGRLGDYQGIHWQVGWEVWESTGLREDEIQIESGCSEWLECKNPWFLLMSVINRYGSLRYLSQSLKCYSFIRDIVDDNLTCVNLINQKLIALFCLPLLKVAVNNQKVPVSAHLSLCNLFHKKHKIRCRFNFNSAALFWPQAVTFLWKWEVQ